jgi:hypothetical protein
LKTPLQVFTILLLFSSVTFANNFKEVFKISLKKDEQKKILVKYDNKERLFKFRWTLYKNDGLVIFHAYDKMVAQNILYLNHKNQSVRVILRNDGQNFYNPPYFLLKFKEFNPKKE